MRRNTLKQIQILPTWFNKTTILTVQNVNIHKFIRSNLMKNRFLTKRILLNYIYGRFPFVRIGRPFHSPTSHFENEKRLFQEFLLKNVLLRAYYLGFDWFSWRVLIKRKPIIIAMEKVWPVNSDKWKAPIFIETGKGHPVIRNKRRIQGSRPSPSPLHYY